MASASVRRGMSTSYVTRSLGLAPETPWDSIVAQLNNSDTLSPDRRAALKNRVAGERIGKYITPGLKVDLQRVGVNTD